MKKCLYCYKPIGSEEGDFHTACSKKIFDLATPPALPYSESDLEPLAKEIINSHTAVAGVQTKLSLHISKDSKDSKGTPFKRFTIVGLWGGYILKPQVSSYAQLPEVEDLTMHLAELARIRTAPHSLIRMSSGNLAYITKRMDRTRTGKLAMEDFCQLMERMTEDKYHGSYEQIAKTIRKYSSAPGLDIINFFELVLFSFLTGNADMHLKNFSLLEHPGTGMIFAPAYDLVNTALVNPADKEDMALTLNAKKRKIKRSDFIAAMNTLHVEEKQQQNIFNKMLEAAPKWIEFIDSSFLNDDYKERYKEIVFERLDRIT